MWDTFTMVLLRYWLISRSADTQEDTLCKCIKPQIPLTRLIIIWNYNYKIISLSDLKTVMRRCTDAGVYKTACIKRTWLHRTRLYNANINFQYDIKKYQLKFRRKLLWVSRGWTALNNINDI